MWNPLASSSGNQRYSTHATSAAQLRHGSLAELPTHPALDVVCNDLSYVSRRILHLFTPKSCLLSQGRDSELQARLKYRALTLSLRAQSFFFRLFVNVLKYTCV